MVSKVRKRNLQMKKHYNKNADHYKHVARQKYDKFERGRPKNTSDVLTKESGNEQTFVHSLIKEIKVTSKLESNVLEETFDTEIPKTLDAAKTINEHTPMKKRKIKEIIVHACQNKKRKRHSHSKAPEHADYNVGNINFNLNEKDVISKISNKLKTLDPLKMNDEINNEAETLLKWCNAYKSEKFNVMRKSVYGTKMKVTNVLKSWHSANNEENSESDIKASLLGCSEHTVFTEAFFSETSYKELTSDTQRLEINEDGKVINLFAPITTCGDNVLKWKCNETICKMPNEYDMEKIRLIFERLSETQLTHYPELVLSFDNCSCNKTSIKQGHLFGEGICPSTLLFMRNLAPHYPLIRHILHLIYSIKRNVTAILEVNTALSNGDIEQLKTVEGAMKSLGKEFQSSEELYVNEDQIIERHPIAFKVHREKSKNLPCTPCVSCEKLCQKTDLTNIDRIKKPIINNIWGYFIEELRKREINDKEICRYCLVKYRNNALPATSFLNNMPSKAPDCIKSLNDFEKILIQRAKAFQVVVRMNPVSNKRQPPSALVEKVIGRTFHLPLPIEETLKKLPHPSEAIMQNQELFVLVRGLPTKQKKIWQSVVSVDKVYNALKWLKENNPLYVDIDLTSARNDIGTAVDIMVEGEHEEINNVNHSTGHEQNILDTVDTSTNTNAMPTRNAMLTQKDPEDCFYDQYTIHSLNEGRINRSSTEIYQMLRVEDMCIPYGDHQLDVKCFPDLYPYGVHGQFSSRPTSIQPSDFIKSRLMSKHPQYRTNKQYLFFLLHDSNLRALRAGIYHKLNIVNCNQKLTSSMCLQLLNNDELERNLTTIFARLRNTQQYWMKPRSDLTCMIMWYGPVTFFLTLSPAEYNWHELGEYIRKVNPGNDGKSIPTLVAMDPVSASRFIDIQFKAMLDFISSDDCPLGKIIHYAWRREYQTRGLQHFHLLLWVRDAPVIGHSTSEEISKFITTYISCKHHDKATFPTLAERIENYQTHKHNSYCMRTKKTKKGFTRRCRFGFPRAITDKFVLNDVAASIAGKRTLSDKRLYDLPRKPNEVLINDYNPSILMAWNGNVDIQFIGEKSCALSSYVTKYQTKAEKSNDQDIFQNLNNTKSLQQKLWNIAMRSLNNRECGSLEASDTLLSLPLFGTDPDTIIKWLDISMMRNRKLKPKSVLESLSDESTDIFCPSLVDTHYPSRPAELDDTCLFDFASNFDIVKVQPRTGLYYTYEGVGFIKQRKNPCLIKHKIYNVVQYPNEYFYGLLILFKPWRSISDLKTTDECYTSAFLAQKDQIPNALEHHKRIQGYRSSLEDLESLVQNILSDSQENKKSSQTELDLCDIENIMEEMKKVTIEDLLDLDNAIEQLNDDQKRIFNTITNHIKEYEENVDQKPLRHFVSGVGGTGKSFLIQIIRQWVKVNTTKNAIVTAPTGIAAYNINGMTIHRLLQLPVEHGKIPIYKPLSDEIIQIIRSNMKDIILIIIDETSMISNVMLMYINQRLCEIYNTTDTDEGWFGKINILLFGDLLQLPPVMGDSPFVDLNQLQCEKYLRSSVNTNLWKELFTYDELTTNMRQKEDKEYADILSRLRTGIVRKNDIETLNSKKISFTKSDKSEKLKELADIIIQLPPDSVTLCATRKQCKDINDYTIGTLKYEEIVLEAEDCLDCPERLKHKLNKKLTKINDDSSRSAGIEKRILIKKNCKIMLLRNLDVSKGLVNGSMGIVKDINKDSENKVTGLMVKFKNFETEITPISAKFEIFQGAYVVRKQFPISVAYAITIHKSQGLTLQHCIVDVGNSIFSYGQTYVALSRVTNLEGLRIINLDPKNIKAQECAIKEYNRLRQNYRPELGDLMIEKNFNVKASDQIWINNDKPHLQNTHVNLEAVTIPGFKNEDGVSCYANATLQCLLDCEAILTSTINYGMESPLKQIMKNYKINSGLLNSFPLRLALGEPFSENEQQDCAEFLNRLISVHQPLQHHFKHSLDITTRCTQCNYSMTNISTNYIFQITIPENKSKLKLKFEELVLNSMDIWKLIENSICCNCNEGSYEQKMSISSTNKFIVFQLQLWRGNGTKIDGLNIPKLPNSRVQINGKFYKLRNAIFHLGGNVNHGHYVAYVQKNNKWVETNDESVNFKKWPYGAKNIYLLIFEN